MPHQLSKRLSLLENRSQCGRILTLAVPRSLSVTQLVGVIGRPILTLLGHSHHFIDSHFAIFRHEDFFEALGVHGYFGVHAVAVKLEEERVGHHGGGLPA